MLELWTAVYMMMLILIVFVVPFTLFYYEQDHDMSVQGKLVSSSWWVAGTFVILGLILGLSYGFAGFVDLPVTTLASGIAVRRLERRARLCRGRLRQDGDVPRVDGDGVRV